MPLSGHGPADERAVADTVEALLDRHRRAQGRFLHVRTEPIGPGLSIVRDNQAIWSRSDDPDRSDRVRIVLLDRPRRAAVRVGLRQGR